MPIPQIEKPMMHLVVNWPGGGADVVNLVPEAVATLRRVWVNQRTGDVVTEMPMPANWNDAPPMFEWSPTFRLEIDPTLALTVDHYDPIPVSPALPSTEARPEGFDWTASPGQQFADWWRGTLRGLRNPLVWAVTVVAVVVEAGLLLTGHLLGAF